MELIREDKKKKIYQDGNKVYTMLDMGDYIGYRNRNWYDSVPEDWRLMFSTEKLNDGRELNIEALVDQNGDYIRFMVSLPGEQRVVQLKYDQVYNDVIYKNNEKYTSLEGDMYSDKTINFQSYFNRENKFKLNMKEYEGILSSNDIIKEFITKNIELRQGITVREKYLGIIKIEKENMMGIDISFISRTSDDIGYLQKWFDLYPNTEHVLLNNTEELDNMFEIFKDYTPITEEEKENNKKIAEKLRRIHSRLPEK